MNEIELRVLLGAYVDEMQKLAGVSRGLLRNPGALPGRVAAWSAGREAAGEIAGGTLSRAQVVNQQPILRNLKQGRISRSAASTQIQRNIGRV